MMEIEIGCQHLGNQVGKENQGHSQIQVISLFSLWHSHSLVSMISLSSQNKLQNFLLH